MFTVRHQKRGRLWNYLRFAYHAARGFRSWFGAFPRECSVCQHAGRFLAFGQPPRFDAMCPSCGSLERHRLLALWLQGQKKALAGKTVLHFAPEEVIGELLRDAGASYIDADSAPGKAGRILDLEDIDLADESIDIVLCSHVLEHVDDKRALAEIRRVLSPGGQALLMFPIVEAWDQTLEEGPLTGSIDSKADRVLYFGQHDHVRYYGRDVRDRISGAGFDLEEFVSREPEVSRFGLCRGEALFIARKKPSSV
jgi:SAM-dependent methyltransferase